MGKNKTLAVIGLIVVIVLAVIFAVKMSSTKVAPPPRVTERPVELIDAETLEVMAKTAAEWKSLGFEGTRYKNPKTGKYTMAVLGGCESCGKPIPFPDRPPIPTKKVRPEMSDAEMDTIIADVLTKRAEALYNYKCPRCGAPHPITGVGP